MTDRGMWPPLLRELAELIGDELALELARREGGLDGVYIPFTTTTDHPWAAVVGSSAWTRIVTAWGGQRISLPRGTNLDPKKSIIIELLQEGLSTREIARRTGSTEHWVRVVRRLAEIDPSSKLDGGAARAHDPQLDLFKK